MKFLIFILITISSVCLAQTQAEMNKNAQEALKKAENEMNTVYQQILTDYKSDKVFIENLKYSQKIWLAFRKAELKIKYPSRESGYYGSIHSMCIALYLEELTKERTQKLKVWLDGVEEGDACQGSVKTKD